MTDRLTDGQKDRLTNTLKNASRINNVFFILVGKERYRLLNNAFALVDVVDVGVLLLKKQCQISINS